MEFAFTILEEIINLLGKSPLDTKLNSYEWNTTKEYRLPKITGVLSKHIQNFFPKFVYENNVKWVWNIYVLFKAYNFIHNFHVWNVSKFGVKYVYNDINFNQIHVG